jgi:cytochrome c biogenesis protein CcmG/thiol:disulfide interchange protein DsbE
MNTMIKVIMICILVLVLTGLGFVIMDTEKKKAQYAGIPEPTVLAEADFIDFTLNTLDGAPVNLTTTVQNNRVNFWATWCGPCRREIPDLISLYREYKGQKVELLAVNVQESAYKVRGFVQEYGMNFPIPIDSDGYVTDKYQIRGIPTTYIIDGRGRIRDRIVGSTNRATLEARIKMILREN